jgi:hypothetical protein
MTTRERVSHHLLEFFSGGWLQLSRAVHVPVTDFADAL